MKMLIPTLMLLAIVATGCSHKDGMMMKDDMSGNMSGDAMMSDTMSGGMQEGAMHDDMSGEMNDGM